MKDKKIALFMLAPLTQGGGAEKYFINLAKNLSVKEDIEADVITFDDKSFRKFARLLHILARGNFFGKIDDYARGMREKREDIKNKLGGAHWVESSRKNLGKILKSYDIIYAKNEITDLLTLKMIGYKKLPPVIVGVHTPIVYLETKSFISKLHNFIYSSLLYKWLLRGAGVIHVSNGPTKDFIDNKFKLKSELIYYPFSVRQIQDFAKKNICNIEFDTDKKNIIFVGRFSEQKGIDALINIIQKISENKNLAEKIAVNIFGSGDKDREDAVKKIAEKNSFVRYFGHIENKFMPHILGQQELMITPSKWETLPYAILEAQALGLPVVAFDIPGPSDIIIDGRTGFLVTSREEFFEKIKDIIEDKIIFDRNVIIQNIEKKFKPKEIYSELINMFQNNL